MKVRKLSLVLGALLLSAALTAQAEDAEPLVLRIGTTNQWWGADATQLDGAFDPQTLAIDSLIACDDDGNMQPAIASAVDVSEDGLTVTFTIPEDLYFATGEQLLPEDIVYSINRFMEISPMSDQLASIESVTEDGQTVVMKLNNYYAGLAGFLCAGFISYLDKDVAETMTDDELLWGAQPYAPYYISDYVEGATVTLTRNDYYKTYNEAVTNKGPMPYDEIDITFYQDDFAILTAINAGEVDMAFDFSTIADQITNPDYTIMPAVPNVTTHYLTMNTHDGYLSDDLVRQAVIYAVDRDAMCEVDQVLTPSYAPLPAELACCDEKFAEEYQAEYGTDPEKAAELLKEAGWEDSDGDGYVDKDGETLELLYVCNDGAIMNDTAQTLLYSLKNIGIKLNIQSFANYGHYNAITEGSYDIGAQQIGWFEPTFIAQMLMWADEENMNQFEGADEYNAVLDEATNNPSSEERAAALYESEKMLTDAHLIIPIYTEASLVLYNDLAAGMIDPVGGPYLYNDMKPVE